MIPFEQLNQQTHEIGELSKVLNVLIEDREICDTDITCDLFMRYSDKVKNHLTLQDTNVYGLLLTHSDKKMNAVGSRFVESSREINRIFNAYMRRWCTKTTHNLAIFNHDMFVKETKDMFHMIAARTQSEIEELYPAARALESSQTAKSA